MTLSTRALVPALDHLPTSTPRSWSAQALLLVAAAIGLPALSHALSLGSSTALPMHWPVLLAGLCYGARAGALLGVLAPVASFALSGMPPAAMLPGMTAELAIYGSVAGLLTATGYPRRALATLAAVLLGRLIFVGVTAFGGTPVSQAVSLLAPGSLAALLQVLLLPALAEWWISRESRRS
jgi:hypothetical protein